MNRKRFRHAILALALAGGVFGAGAPSPAKALPDNGSWSVACTSGRGCFWRTTCYSGTVLASTVRDSNFSNDFFGDGTVLNDHAYCGSNNYTSTSIRLYTAADYMPNASICFGSGAVSGYANNGDFSGLSSFKSC